VSLNGVPIRILLVGEAKDACRLRDLLNTEVSWHFHIAHVSDLNLAAERLSSEPADVLLLVEVSDSSLTFDQGVKLRIYARYGVAEYWVVDVEGRRIITYREPVGQGYARTLEFAGTDVVAPPTFPDVKIVVGDLFS